MIIGYTTGCFDLFHIGHLNLLKNAKSYCDKLFVGVSTDELILSYKNKLPYITFNDRVEIVRSIKFVDAAFPQKDWDKLTACKKLNANLLFIGDDWYNTEKWNKYEEEFSSNSIKIIYLPYTENISSTLIKNKLASN